MILFPIQYVVKFKSFYARILVKHSKHRSCHKMTYNKYFTTRRNKIFWRAHKSSFKVFTMIFIHKVVTFLTYFYNLLKIVTILMWNLLFWKLKYFLTLKLIKILCIFIWQSCTSKWVVNFKREFHITKFSYKTIHLNLVATKSQDTSKWLTS